MGSLEPGKGPDPDPLLPVDGGGQEEEWGKEVQYLVSFGLLSWLPIAISVDFGLWSFYYSIV